MPVTTYPAGHKAKEFTKAVASSFNDLSRCASEKDCKVDKDVIQTSFSDDIFVDRSIVGKEHGFISTAVDAYNQHHHLIIRPDDIWISILVQFSIYVNANAEELRSTFVKYKDEKTIIVRDIGSIRTVDFGALALRFKEEIRSTLIKADLVTWALPSFSTTTATDEIVSAVSLMSTLQSYYSYHVHLRCGLPSVTLLGEKADWEDLLQRLDRLAHFGKEPTRWSELLKPVLRRFVKTFDEPESDDTKTFWQTIVHHTGGSGTNYFSGWITAFAYWGDKGRELHEPFENLEKTMSYRSKRKKAQKLVLDGIEYPVIDSTRVPMGTTVTPVKVDDNGTVHETTMIAGVFGYYVESAPLGINGRVDFRRDTVRPAVGWGMVEAHVKSEKMPLLDICENDRSSDDSDYVELSPADDDSDYDSCKDDDDEDDSKESDEEDEDATDKLDDLVDGVVLDVDIPVEDEAK